MIRSARVKLAAFLLLAVACVFIAGCDSDIAEKVILKQQLSPQEQRRYKEAKDAIDIEIDKILGGIADYVMVGEENRLQDKAKAKLANNRERVDRIIDEKLADFSTKIIAGVDLDDKEKKIRDKYIHRLQTKFVPETVERLQKENKLVYKRFKGVPGIFDASENVHKQFGFNSGDRISTPWGDATVIGIFEKHLWIHIDGKKGATFSSELKDFKLLEPGKAEKPKQAKPKTTQVADVKKDVAPQNVVHKRPPTSSKAGLGHGEGIYFKRFDSIPEIPYAREE